MEIKEFRYPDEDEEYSDTRVWDSVYSVLVHDRGFCVSNNVEAMERVYVINADEPVNAFKVYSSEVDHYIEIFNWIKQRESVNNE